MTVYIPTRNRHKNLRKVVPAWLAQGQDVVLVTEASEWQVHENLCEVMGWHIDRSPWVAVESPGKREAGIGNARAFCVWHADQMGLESIIMADDDVLPGKGADMSLLLKEAAVPGVLGISGVRRILDHFTGGAISRNRGVILCPNGSAFQLFGLNVATTLKLGNFDPEIDMFGEDAELARQGIAAGIPWLLHCDVPVDAIGVRYDPGGLSTFAGDRERRAERELACHQLVHDRWPKYVSRPPAKFRMSWAKMLTDYIPDWRSRSAIHGGKW